MILTFHVFYRCMLMEYEIKRLHCESQVTNLHPKNYSMPWSTYDSHIFYYPSSFNRSCIVPKIYLIQDSHFMNYVRHYETWSIANIWVSTMLLCSSLHLNNNAWIVKIIRLNFYLKDNLVILSTHRLVSTITFFL